jgi:hypothetical protein
MRLHLSCRRNDDIDQVIRGKINGQPLFQHQFDSGFEFVDLTYEFETKPGMNELALNYDRWYQLDPPGRQRAVMFRALTILPSETGR